MIALRREATMVTHEDFMDAIVEVQAKKKANLNYYAWENKEKNNPINHKKRRIFFCLVPKKFLICLLFSILLPRVSMG